MANYRLIHKEASTGERSSGLSHLGFRVWMQYQHSADDFGVCPAEAAKFQGDNPALQREPQKRIQAEIENLIAVHLCEVFLDGRRRYLYQIDWQDWQRIRHTSATSYPAIPAELLQKCSPDTVELFQKHPKRFPPKLPPHAGARNAHANANASANAHENANARPIISGEAAPLGWGKNHSSHVAGFCDFVCFPETVFNDCVNRVMNAGATEPDAAREVTAWARSVRQAWSGRIPGDDIFHFWRNEWLKTHGSNKPSTGGVDVTAGLRNA